MFSHDDILARIREKPFRPFRVIVSEGQRFDVHHPDLVFVGRRDMMIGFPGPDNPHAYDRVTRVAFVHVVALEDIFTPAPPANGQQG